MATHRGAGSSSLSWFPTHGDVCDHWVCRSHSFQLAMLAMQRLSFGRKSPLLFCRMFYVRWKMPVNGKRPNSIQSNAALNVARVDNIVVPRHEGFSVSAREWDRVLK